MFTSFSKPMRIFAFFFRALPTSPKMDTCMLNDKSILRLCRNPALRHAFFVSSRSDPVTCLIGVSHWDELLGPSDSGVDHLANVMLRKLQRMSWRHKQTKRGLITWVQEDHFLFLPLGTSKCPLLWCNSHKLQIVN